MDYLRVDEAYVASHIRPRRLWARKGEHGRVLVVGGSRLYHGAPILAALAAYRTGADLVYLAIPRIHEMPARATSPSLIVLPLPDVKLTTGSAKRLLKWMPEVHAALLGPGLGQQPLEGLKLLVRELCYRGLKLVLDGDALRREVVEIARGKQVVLTPHAGEFLRIGGANLTEEVAQRAAAVRQLASELSVTILLKGAIDVISDGTSVMIDEHGTPALTVGGVGDITAGICAALLAMGLEPLAAAAVAAYTIGRCGEAAYQRLGFHLLPTDLLEEIPRQLKPFDRIGMEAQAP
jgi:NAD(P)H-hydrate epimerase